MIAVSSFRPLRDCSPVIFRNQLRAITSWQSQFQRIYFFGPYEHALASPITTFIEREPFPRIATLASFCAEQRGWSVIVNSDIVLRNIPRIELELHRKGALCAISRRFEFEGEELDKAKVVDLGLDFFACNPGVWNKVAQAVPHEFRLGQILWDTFLLGFLTVHYSQKIYEITDCKAVYHPKHADRRQTLTVDKSLGASYLAAVRWPVNRIKL